VSELVIKTNDTWPKVKAVLEETNPTNGKKEPINLTGNESIKMVMKSGAGTHIELAAVVVGEAKNGEVEMDWTSTAKSTEVAGIYNVEWKIKWSSTHTETVPNKGYDTILIEAAL
jgi:hypothetical protein